MGESQAGKTQLFEQFAQQSFTEVHLHTICVNYVPFTQRFVEVLGESHCIRVSVWDIPGPVRSQPMGVYYYQRAEGVILVYSTTDTASLHQIPEWMESIRQVTPEAALLLVGTKADLRNAREVSYCQGVQLAERLGVPFLETSAKAGINVDEAYFMLLVGRGRWPMSSGFTVTKKRANRSFR